MSPLMSALQAVKMPLMLAGGGSIDVAPLTQDEQHLFDDGMAHLARHVGIVGGSGDPMYQILMDWYPEFLFACKVAKQQLDMSFGGINAGGSQFGMHFIRPRVFGAAYLTAYWWQTWAAVGWQNVWGTAAANITMPDTTGARALICFPMILSGSASPKVTEVRFGVEGVDYPIWPIKAWNRIGDIYAATLAGAIIVPPGNGFYMRANIDALGNDELIPLGLQFSISTYMRTE